MKINMMSPDGWRNRNSIGEIIIITRARSEDGFDFD